MAVSGVEYVTIIRWFNSQLPVSFFGMFYFLDLFKRNSDTVFAEIIERSVIHDKV